MIPVYNKWTTASCGNKIIRRIDDSGLEGTESKKKEFYISYREDPDPETALVIYYKRPKRTMCFVLTGDFRKEYTSVETVSEALKVYNKYKDKYRNNWSTD